MVAPHLHLGFAAGVAHQGLATAHLPTGYVAPHAVELGAQWRRSGAVAALAEALLAYEPSVRA